MEQVASEKKESIFTYYKVSVHKYIYQCKLLIYNIGTDRGRRLGACALPPRPSKVGPVPPNPLPPPPLNDSDLDPRLYRRLQTHIPPSYGDYCVLYNL